MKNKKYILQKDSYSCGTIAFLNILNYFGKSYTSKDLPKFRKLLKTHKIYGTYQKYINKELRKRKVSIGNRTYKYNTKYGYLACYISNTKGIMHYIYILPEGIAINFHHYNKDKMYLKYKLPKKWIMDRLKRKTIYLWRITKKI
jgi:hypothetical protein